MGKIRLMNVQLQYLMTANYVMTQLDHVNRWEHAQSTVQILDIDSVRDLDCVFLLVQEASVEHQVWSNNMNCIFRD